MSEQSFNVIRDRVNEISNRVIDDAYDRSDDLFYQVRYSFEEFRDMVDYVIGRVERDSENGEQKSNPYLNRIKELVDEIEEILLKKKRQQKKFFNATN